MDARMNGGGVDDSDDTAARKRSLRKEALARRRRVGEAERIEAGRRLAVAGRRIAELMRSDGVVPPSRVPATNGSGDDTTGSRTETGGSGTKTGTTRPTVAAYVSMGTEVPMDDLLDELVRSGSRVLVPVLGSGLDLGWAEFTGGNDLHDAGPRRPKEPSGPVLPAETIADAGLIITAGIMVDRSGLRLGRGGGWYDRMLAMKSPTARVITVVWPWEVVDGPLPHEPWDRPVDGVLTPDGLTMFE
ncbi:5-formyltetrahydrofolate cyclo-ligase [Bifidobacterium simiarum]|uniref:5-formyltetrahydrofolate cyclo-ligase n=1 Tax=Bifidobacterium simiarum TaxID=2045441 RepID=UPI001BDD9A1C|nr:5-formyltetrahydrofolate cyclo-ligase [Bifidobacterium simiarum]MBT1166071.1 5-formyltetrahydrofolate cyclo-ligase [Bifidobacterium simiarum]